MTTTPPIDEAHGLRAAIWSVALVGAALTLGSPFLVGARGIAGVAFGAALAVLNLWTLGRVVRAFVAGAGLPWVFIGALKLFALLAIVALLLHSGLATVMTLALGYAALPLGIVLAQLGPRSAHTEAPDYSGRIEGDPARKG